MAHHHERQRCHQEDSNHVELSRMFICNLDGSSTDCPQTYWNLDGFQNPLTNSALNYTFHLPYSGQRIDIDNIEIPTGDILANQPGSVHDWWSTPKQLGSNITSPLLTGSCGYNCTGYDNAYLVNREQLGSYDWRTEGPVASLASPFSGIQLDIYSDQEAFQLYTCNNMNGKPVCSHTTWFAVLTSVGTLALKQTQGFFNVSSRPRTVGQFDCLVMEVEDWIDAINQPEWQRSNKQIFGPGDAPYTLNAVYNFSINKTLAATFNQTKTTTSYRR